MVSVTSVFLFIHLSVDKYFHQFPSALESVPTVENWLDERECGFSSNCAHFHCKEGTATFIAKIGGEPIPSVKWMKGKWRQITPGGRISIQHKGQDAKMEIREVTKSDAGTYRCVASNKHGEIECSAEMEVTKKQEVGELGDVRVMLKK